MGNRLNLPNADVITALGLPTTFVEGAAGVRPSLPNTGGGNTLPTPVYPVAVHLAMDSQRVADALQVALADRLAGGVLDAFRLTNEVVHVVGHWTGRSGAAGTGRALGSQYLLVRRRLVRRPVRGLQRVRHGRRADPAGFPGAQRMWNNQREGVYVDDIVIGFAGRGEMVTYPTTQPPPQTPQFVPNPVQPGNEIDTGAYQLEIRLRHPMAKPSPLRTSSRVCC